MGASSSYPHFEGHVRQVNRGFVGTFSKKSSRSVGRAAQWQARYVKLLVLSDLIVVAIAVFVSQLIWLPLGYKLQFEPFDQRFSWSYWWVSTFIILFWMIGLAFSRCYDTKVIAFGDEEYTRVIRGTVFAFALISTVAYWSKTELARGYVLLSVPIAIVLLIVSRWLWRLWIASQWKKGRDLTSVLVVGEGEALEAVVTNLQRTHRSPYSILGIANTADEGRPEGTVTINGETYRTLPYREDISEQMKEIGAQSVVIVAGPLSSPDRIREIGWTLDQSCQQMLLAPGITDVAGPRVSVRVSAGMPLVVVNPAAPTKLARFGKRTFDVVVSGLLITLLSPLLLGVALAVKLTDGGSVFYTQERIGFMGKPFKIWKFRSMRVNADKLEAQMISEGDAGNTVQFKMKNDPRITPIGRFIRRYSIDELPQLFNVFGGSMSLVGPRPHQAREVDLYEKQVYRRFLVRPGITGLWQVSGRSNLSWEDSVRLDLYYVENWEFMNDVRILWHTFSAVLEGDGAY